jgi:hypothetical protein
LLKWLTFNLTSSQPAIEASDGYAECTECTASINGNISDIYTALNKGSIKFIGTNYVQYIQGQVNSAFNTSLGGYIDLKDTLWNVTSSIAFKWLKGSINASSTGIVNAVNAAKLSDESTGLQYLINSLGVLVLNNSTILLGDLGGVNGGGFVDNQNVFPPLLILRALSGIAQTAANVARGSRDIPVLKLLSGFTGPVVTGRSIALPRLNLVAGRGLSVIQQPSLIVELGFPFFIFPFSGYPAGSVIV